MRRAFRYDISLAVVIARQCGRTTWCWTARSRGAVSLLLAALFVMMTWLVRFDSPTKVWDLERLLAGGAAALRALYSWGDDIVTGTLEAVALWRCENIWRAPIFCLVEFALYFRFQRADRKVMLLCRTISLVGPNV